LTGTELEGRKREGGVEGPFVFCPFLSSDERKKKGEVSASALPSAVLRKGKEGKSFSSSNFALYMRKKGGEKGRCARSRGERRETKKRRGRNFWLGSKGECHLLTLCNFILRKRRKRSAEKKGPATLHSIGAAKRRRKGGEI